MSIYVRYSTELLEKVVEMAEGIEVEDAPVFKTRDEIIKNQQVDIWTHAHTRMLNSNGCPPCVHVSTLGSMTSSAVTSVLVEG